MSDQFDELAKGMAQSVTRRGALKNFGVGLAGIALATLGLVNKAEAKWGRCCACWSRCAHKGITDCSSYCGCVCTGPF